MSFNTNDIIIEKNTLREGRVCSDETLSCVFVIFDGDPKLYNIQTEDLLKKWSYCEEHNNSYLFNEKCQECMNKIPSVDEQTGKVKSEISEMNERIKELREEKKDDLTMTFSFKDLNDSFEEDRVVRLILVDRAFSVIQDLRDELRRVHKYGLEAKTKKEEFEKYYDFCDSLMNIIDESSLLDYWR